MKKFALSLIVGLAVACTAFAAEPVKLSPIWGN